MAPLLGPVWTPDGQPLPVAAFGGSGVHPERHRQRTRVVVDDYGNAVCYQRRCSKCRRWLPLNFDHFAANSSGRSLGLQSSCSRCGAAGKWLALRHDADRVRARNREGYRRRMQDAEYRARLLERTKRNTERARDRDPEAFRELQAQRSREYRIKLNKDSQRYARQRETQRINYRLRRERDEGVPLGEIRAFASVIRAKETGGMMMAAQPLAEAIDSYARLRHLSIGEVCDLVDIDPRQLLAWRVGDIEHIQFNVADRALTNLGLLWFDVWPDEEKAA